MANDDVPGCFKSSLCLMLNVSKTNISHCLPVFSGFFVRSNLKNFTLIMCHSAKHSTKLQLVVAAFFLCVFCVDGVNGQLTSPCPQVFEYKYDGYNSYGIARLPAGIGTVNLQVQLALDGTPDQSNPAKITTLDSDSEVIQKLQTGGSIKYKIGFPSGINSIPEILSIMLNNQEYCDNSDGVTFTRILTVQYKVALARPGGGTISPPTTPTTTPKSTPQSNFQPVRQKPSGGNTVIFEPQSVLRPDNFHTINSSPRPSSLGFLSRIQDDWLFSYKFNSICGRKDVTAIHTVINGRDVAPHEFPWLAALFDNRRNYFCGGSLVSDKHIISAAHCTVDKQWVLIELGKHELDNRSESGVALRISESIVNHPEYAPNTGHADISIITVSEKVSFTDKIKPICLWPYESHNVGIVGTVAGWGKDISGEGTNTPMAAQVDIVSDIDCRNSNQVFSTITSATTFCAGGKNKGPCSGDSGSGFIIEDNNRWYLKGIISTSLKAGYSSCDVNKFAVYCDVGKYLNWIKNYLLRT